MSAGLPVVSLDFETASELDLRKFPVYDYAEHKSTRVLCAAYTVDDNPGVSLWSPGDPVPEPIKWVSQGSAILAAWNAQFEWVIINYLLARREGWPSVDLKYVRCTMAASMYYGYPASLDQAAPAMGLGVTKDQQGHRLMLQMARPRTREPLTWWHETDQSKYADLKAYCVQDVVVERACREALPGFLPPAEQAVWWADQRINARGVCVDKTLVKCLQKITEAENQRLNDDLAKVTGGEVTACTQVSRLLAWANGQLKAHGINHTITSLSKNDLPGLIKSAAKHQLDDLRDALAIRQEAAKSSTAKLDVLARVRAHSPRLRGTLQYYGAQRTGRWSGRLFQPQNLPRGELKAPVAVAERLARHGNLDEALKPENAGSGVTPLTSVSSLLRSCLVGPKPAFTPGAWMRRLPLYTPDLSQIEARVLPWLAGQQDVLDVFAQGKDVYAYDAKQIGSDDRQLGKVCRLGLGFGMGPPKFQDTAAAPPYNIKLDLDAAEQVVYGWRDNNPRITAYWTDLDRMFIRCALNAANGRNVRLDLVSMKDRRARPQTTITGRREANHTVTVIITLPSGRELYYRDVVIQQEELGFRITFMGIDQTTRRWARIDTYGGKLAENVTQAVARDVIALWLVSLELNGAQAGSADEHGTGHLRPVLSVHDEIVLENHWPHEGIDLQLTDRMDLINASEDLIQESFISLTETPWLAGLPLAYETKMLGRYAK